MSGHNAAITTHPYPTKVEVSTPQTGTPRLFFLANQLGASLFELNTCSKRDAVYKPAFSTDNTATRITTVSIVPAPGIPIFSSVATKGDYPGIILVQGCATTMNSVDKTKKTKIRAITVFTARRMFCEGLSDSAAAIVATSTPLIEKIT
ncbi:hypothetical protein K027_4421, partial [Acinetobacter baumannii 45057_1]